MQNDQMMNQLKLLIFLCLFSLSGYAQYDKSFYLVDSLQLQNGTLSQKNLDSILTIYHKTEDPLEKIKLLNSYSMIINTSSTLKPYNAFILEKLQEIENEYGDQEDFKIEKNIAKVFQAKLLIEEGKIFQGIQIAKEVNSVEGIEGLKEIQALNLSNLGYAYMQMSDLEQALDYFFKSLKESEKVGKYEYQVSALINLGAACMYQGDFEASEDYSNRALEVAKKSENINLIGAAYNNLGSIQVEKGNLEKASEYYQIGLDYSLKYGDLEGVSAGYNNLGYMFYAYSQLDSALYYYKKSAAIDIACQNYTVLIATTNSIAAIFGHLNQLDSAKFYVDQAIDYAKSKNNLYELSYAYSLKYKIHKKEGDYKQALQYYEKHRKTEDSIQSEQNINLLSDQKAKYEYEKRKAVDDAQHDKELAIEKEEKARQTLISYGIGGGLLLILFFAVFIYNRLQITRKQKKVIESQKLLVEEQKEIVEEKNREILDSITYAKRIQNAILPPDDLIQKEIPNSFVLYKPKDIVAGDFYWMEKVASDENRGTSEDLASRSSNPAPILIAAADCTGHGVPGAMVSVVCNHGLNRSVREFGLTDPGKILDKTRELVIQEFEKSTEDVKDGMDIALIALERNLKGESESSLTRSHSLSYSGAHNPLWIIRKGASEIEEIKASKQPIGKYHDPKPFESHQVELKAGDSIYIFSDGFADQFGGEKGKKFKAKNFKKLLLSIQGLTLEEQKESLDQAFENWRGDIEQLDDICVIGIRV